MIPALPCPAVFDHDELKQLRLQARPTVNRRIARRDEAVAPVAVFDWNHFRMLASRVQAPERDNESASQPHKSADRPKLVLVVDDDATIRQVVQLALLDEGYDVVQAEHGRRALELVDARQPSVILLDKNMPVMDGPAFCEALAEHAPVTRPAIVVMTTSDTVHDFCEHCHADGELGKPFALDDLYAVVRRAAA